MSVKKILLTALAATGLAGCQSMPPQATEPAPAPVASEPAAAQATEKKSAPTEPLIMSDIVYGVLAGDIASQRGDYLVAYKHYLYAARLGKNAGLAELATKAALAAQDQEAARNAVLYWIELTPEHLGALQIAALLNAQDGDLQGATAYLRRVVKIKKEQGDNGYLDVARMLSKIGNAALRLELMQRLTHGHQDDADALFSLAIVEAGSHQFKQAEATVRQALKIRPQWDEARVLLVRMLAAQGDKDRARAELERFLADSPDDIKLRGAYARLLVEQDDSDGAREQFKRLLEADPDDADTLFALGILALQAEQLDEAEKYLQRLYSTGEHRDEAAYYLGQIYENNEDNQQALRWYHRVEGSNLFDARVRIAHIHAKTGEISRAREIIQQLRGRSGKNSSQLYLIESEILRAVEQYQAAIDVLDVALQSHPDDTELLYARALTAVDIDRIDILEADLKKVLEQDPDHADALNALGYTLADQTERYAEALGYIQRAIKIKPDSPAIMDSMGWVQYRMGNKQEALRYLWRAMELLPDAEIAAHLGEVLWEEGERKRAREIWEEALVKDPESEYLLKMLERYGKHF